MLKGMPFLFIDDNEGIFMVEVEEIKEVSRRRCLANG